MGRRKGGFRRGTRYKLQKSSRDKGKLSMTRFFQSFNEGEKVLLTAEPAYQKGMYFPRYHGVVGVVNGKQGSCYNVAIKDHDKEKIIVIHPVHLKKMQ
jgi:ribosomal protein L21E